MRKRTCPLPRSSLKQRLVLDVLGCYHSVLRSSASNLTQRSKAHLDLPACAVVHQQVLLHMLDYHK